MSLQKIAQTLDLNKLLNLLRSYSWLIPRLSSTMAGRPVPGPAAAAMWSEEIPSPISSRMAPAAAAMWSEETPLPPKPLAITRGSNLSKGPPNMTLPNLPKRLRQPYLAGVVTGMAAGLPARLPFWLASMTRSPFSFLPF